MLPGRLMIDNIKNKMENKKIPYYKNPTETNGKRGKLSTTNITAHLN